MKQLRILFIIGTILCGLPMMGQTKEKTLEYGGWVEEFVTHTAITNAKLTLLDDKGEVVKETISDERNEQKNGGFTFIVANNHRYTIKENKKLCKIRRSEYPEICKIRHSDISKHIK